MNRLNLFSNALISIFILFSCSNEQIESYEITNEAGELLVEANTVLAFVDMKTKRPIRAPQYIVDAISKG